MNNKCAPTFSITELTVLNHGTDISYASSRTIDVGMDRLRATYPLIDCSASPIKLKKYLPNFSQVFSPKGLVLDKRLFRLKGPTRNKNTRCDTGIPGLHEFTCENTCRSYISKKKKYCLFSFMNPISNFKTSCLGAKAKRRHIARHNASTGCVWNSRAGLMDVEDASMEALRPASVYNAD